MHERDDELGMPGPTPEARAAMHKAQRMFHRHLASWASDLMALRAGQLDRPRWARDAAHSQPWSKAA